MDEHTQTIKAMQLRQNMAATLRRVEEHGDKYTVTSHGRSVAVLVPVELYNRLALNGGQPDQESTQ